MYLIARVASSTLAIPGWRCRQVVPPGPRARLPRSGSPVTSIALSNGGLVPVADLGAVLGLETHNGENSTSWMVVIDAGGGEQLGLLVDDVTTVRFLGAVDSAPSTTDAEPDDLGLISSVEPDEVMRLDVDAILAATATETARNPTLPNP